MRYLIFCLCMLPCALWALPKERADVRAGNKDYKKGDYPAAEIDYRRALDKVASSVNARYNLGNALLKQMDSLAMQSPDETAKEQLKDIRNYYASLAESSGKLELSANAHFNIGNTYLLEQDWKSAVEAYKKTLRLNPTDIEAKENLVFAQAMSQNPPPQNCNNPKDSDSEDNKDNQNQQPNQQNESGQDKKQQEQPNVSKDDAQRMLQAMEQQEKDTQDKVKKEKARRLKKRSSEKNW